MSRARMCSNHIIWRKVICTTTGLYTNTMNKWHSCGVYGYVLGTPDTSFSGRSTRKARNALTSNAFRSSVARNTLNNLNNRWWHMTVWNNLIALENMDYKIHTIKVHCTSSSPHHHHHHHHEPCTQRTLEYRMTVWFH